MLPLACNHQFQNNPNYYINQTNPNKIFLIEQPTSNKPPLYLPKNPSNPRYANIIRGLQCLTFFINANQELNPYINKNTLTDLRSHCLKQAELVKNHLMEKRKSLPPAPPQNKLARSNSLPGKTPLLTPAESAFMLMPEDESVTPESTFFDRMYSYKIRKKSEIFTNQPLLKKKKDLGQKWFDSQKSVQYLLNTSTKDLKNARSCALNKRPENVYFLLTKIYTRMAKKLN